MTATATTWADRWLYTERGYATDTVTHPVRPFPITEALGKRYVRTGVRALTNMIVLDVDDDDAARTVKSLAWDDETIPEPSWITTNPATGHAHVGYWLAEPVTLTARGSQRAVQYLHNVSDALTATVGADRGFAGYLTRNPLHAGHNTEFLRDEPHTLGSLRDALGDRYSTKTPRQRGRLHALRGSGSRHQDLFVDTAAWANANHRYFPTCEAFERAVQVQAEVFALEYITDPLPASDVYGTARRAARWAWSTLHTTRAMEDFSARQAHRASMRGKRTRAAVQALATTTEGPTMSRTELAEAAGVSVRTVQRAVPIPPITKIIDTAAERRATAYHLRYDDGLGYQAIADRMGISTPAVKSLLQRARIERGEGPKRTTG